MIKVKKENGKVFVKRIKDEKFKELNEVQQEYYKKYANDFILRDFKEVKKIFIKDNWQGVKNGDLVVEHKIITVINTASQEKRNLIRSLFYNVKNNNIVLTLKTLEGYIEVKE